MKRISATVGFVCLLLAWASPDASAADADVTQLVTTEMEAQIRPEVRRQLDQAWPSIDIDPEAVLGGLAPLLARADSRELNYWETFEVYYIVGEANRIRRDDAKARTALEQCLAFTDIEPQRRRKALVAIGKVYERQKDADAALDVYAELNNMRGGKYPKMLMAIADVHMTIFGDRAAAIPYLEAAIEHASGAPNRAHYLKLRRAYHQHGDRQSALNVANAMVDLFDNPADEEAVDDIVSAMNRRVP